MVFRKMDQISFGSVADQTRCGLDVDLDRAFHFYHGAAARLRNSGINRDQSLSHLSFFAIRPGTCVVCCIIYRVGICPSSARRVIGCYGSYVGVDISWCSTDSAWCYVMFSKEGSLVP